MPWARFSRWSEQWSLWVKLAIDDPPEACGTVATLGVIFL
jgi:hypothetical protein